MATSVSREQIQESLKAFSNGNLRDNAQRLFDTLGYRSERRQDLSPNTAEEFLETFDPEKKLNAKTAPLHLLKQIFPRRVWRAAAPLPGR
jgi:hypothetical protein